MSGRAGSSQSWNFTLCFSVGSRFESEETFIQGAERQTRVPNHIVDAIAVNVRPVRERGHFPENLARGSHATISRRNFELSGSTVSGVVGGCYGARLARCR